MAQWLVRLGAFGLALFSAVPALAQKPIEPPARRGAALADYRRICAPLIGPFIEFKVNTSDHYNRRSTRSEATSEADNEFLYGRDDGGSNYLPDQYRGLRSVEAMRIRVSNATQKIALRASPPNRLGKCAVEVALRHALNGVPGYDHGASSSRPSTPAPRPNVAAKPRPAPPVEKLPPARPAKMAAWSPKAMSTVATQKISPQFAAERADALASCTGPIRAVGTEASAELNLIVEHHWLDDDMMTENAVRLREIIKNSELWIASKGITAAKRAAHVAGRCVLQRHLARLEGSPLITGSADGTLNPLSIGSPGTQWKQQGKDARIIASNGKSAMHCVKLEQVSSGDSKVGVGGRRLFNYCPEEVEITWCNTPGCSTPTGGNTWTVQPNMGWPVSANGDVRWAACLGRDTAAFVKGSHGLRYYCTEPLVKPRR